VYTVQQVAQLPQTDRAAGWVSLAKSRRLERGDNILRTFRSIFNQLWHNWPAKLSNAEKSKIKAITPFKVIHSHSRSSTTVSIESPYAISY